MSYIQNFAFDFLIGTCINILATDTHPLFKF